MRYGTLKPVACSTSAATRSTTAFISDSSLGMLTSGIMTSASTVSPISFGTAAAASKMARACIS